MQALDAGNFSESKEKLYLLSSSYKSLSDSVNLCKTWIGISCLEQLMDRYTHYLAAQRIAKQYHKNKDGFYDLAFTNGNANSETLRSIEDPFFCKLGYLLLTQELKRRSNLSEGKTDELINILSSKQDTLWCGYRNLLFERGLALFEKMSYKKSLGYFLRVIQISESIHSVSYECIRAYKYVISSLGNLGNDEQKVYYFNRFVTLYDHKLTDKNLLCEYLTIKGAYYYVNKMYSEANTAYELSLNIKRASGLDFRNEIYYLATSNFYMGDYRKVVELSQISKGFKDTFYNLIVAFSYLKIGKIELARKLEKEISKQELIKQSATLTLQLYWLSVFYKEIRDYREAEHFLHLYLKQSIKLFSDKHFSVSQAYGNCAYFKWVINGNVADALSYYQHELCILLREDYHTDYFKIPDISKSINNEALAVCLRNRGEAFLELSKLQTTYSNKMKYLQACLDNFDLAFKALSRHKFALLSEEKQLSYTNLTRHYYSYVIECCYQMFMISGDRKYANLAFTYLEKSKASVLLSIMKGSEARKLKLVPEWVINKEDYIKENAVKYARLIADENSKAAPEYSVIDQLNNKLQDLSLQQDTLIKEIKGKFPSYYKVKYGAEVVSVIDVQKRLKESQVLVQYALNKNNVFIFMVSRDNYKVIKANIDTAFISNINKYRTAVSKFSYDDVKDACIYAYADRAYGLYRTLLEPLKEQIKGKELIVIPDDILNTIPFEPLLTQKVQKKKNIKYKDLPYLIAENSVIYNYSASLFVQSDEFTVDEAKEPQLLALAPIHSAFTLSDINKVTRDSDEIVPIPGTINEVKGIHKIFSGKILLGKKATEGRFKAICDQYQIIHIASHGFVNNEHPLFSRLVFNKNKQDTLNDGLLNTYEIYNMHLSAPLVVLSACNTGSGKLYRGEGTISLARGFYVAGAQNIIMTLWAITDKTSNELIQNFYSHLVGNEPVPVSLQQAKLGFLQNADEIVAHPFFWAGYISIGEPEVRFATVNKSHHYFWFAAAGIILLVSSVLFWRIRRKPTIS
ncbi:MAG TPA: CHAT domain-containing protein [Bacteroidales bacterium]|nr:CHAT domain-containing protein [Bacteroidales bacterium]